MSEVDGLSIAEILSGFSDLTLKRKSDLMLELLINKSAENSAAFDSKSLEDSFTVCMNHLISPSKKSSRLIDLCLSLLCNLTVTEENSQRFLHKYLLLESSGVSTLTSELLFLMESFLTYDSQLSEVDSVDTDGSAGPSVDSTDSQDWGERDPWQHMSSILCNLTRLEGGRKIILKQHYMTRLVRQIRSRNAVRRRGVVACLRTCLFENEIHWWILHEVGILPYIMLPIIVATPFTDAEKVGMDPVLWLNAQNPMKKWEPETDILLMLLECVILLCQKRGIREELRKRQVYPMCRNLDYLQEDEDVSNLILEIVNLLMRDEDPDAPLEVDGNDAALKGETLLALEGGESKPSNPLDNTLKTKKIDSKILGDCSTSFDNCLDVVD
jgi:Domain of unknown function (DUF383)/Domain of unknown function (DUF384)